MKEVIMQVASYPSDYPKAPIYVADLVRCKECKAHYDVNKNPAHIMCGYMSDDDFCSYGERKESE